MPYTNGIETNASLDRLEKLIGERLAAGTDEKAKEAIDRRIWDLFGEEWAVMFTDLSGFSRRVAEFGIIHFLQIIFESQRILVPCIDRCDGILLKSEGDSFLVIFRSPVKAVECAVEMQRVAEEYNRGKPDAEKVLLCVGIGCGKVLRIGDRDVFGAEVNAAAKLGEDTAKAREILITDSVKDAVQGLRGMSAEPIDVVPPGAKSAFRLKY